jgi:hypothetical protein
MPDFQAILGLSILKKANVRERKEVVRKSRYI